MKYLLAGLVAAAGLLLLVWYAPLGADWDVTYGPMGQHYTDPFKVPTFVNPPYIALLLPHTLTPLRVGNAINLALNIMAPAYVLYAYSANPRQTALLWLMVFTSPPFIELIRTNNVEWIPLLGAVLPPGLALIVLSVKPQTLGGMAWVKWQESGFSWAVLIPVVALWVGSVVVWGAWWQGIQWAAVKDAWPAVNFSPFPYFVPVGAWMLWHGIRTKDQAIAGAATPLLVPYFSIHSIFPVLVILATKHRKEAGYLYAGLWLYFFIEAKRRGIL